MKQIAIYHYRNVLLFLTLFFVSSLAAFGQLQWNSYNNVGVQVGTNVASGGDATYGNGVNFTVPANSNLVFMTETFVPIGLPAASTLQKVNFYMTASGALYPGNTGRLFGMGLFNNPNTPSSAASAQGYWADFNTGNPSFELFYRTSTVTTFFQFNTNIKLGSSTLKTGFPTNGVTYGMQFQINMNSGATGISIGTGDGSFSVSGAGMTNTTGSVDELADSSANLLTTLATTNFNQFAFEFNNQSASPVTVTLSGITLVPANPVLASQPVNTGGSPGGNYSLSVTLNSFSAGPLFYQWYQTNGITTNTLVNGLTGTGSTISGATNATLSINNAQTGDNGGYYVVVTNAYGAVTSSVATLSVSGSSTLPVISSVSTTNAIVIAGNGTNISVVTVGTPTPTVYWFDNNNNLLQASTATELSLANLQMANAGLYTILSSNSAGSVSTNFFVTVDTVPTISQQPTNQLVNVGQPAMFSVTASSTPTPTYQWYYNNVAISGATSSTYSISSVALTNIGNYTVVAADPVGSITSSNAVLAVYSSMIGTPSSPANNATGACVDTLLSITFNTPPVAGTAGNINIYNAANPSTPVDTINMSAGNLQLRSIGGVNISTYAILINGNTATIYPHAGVLTTNATYYVTIDPGVITDTNGAYFIGISGSSTWQFTTKPNGPANPASLVVDAGGNGDFCTVQGAINSIPSTNSTPTVVNIDNGIYTEVDRVSLKTNVTFIGQSRHGVIITYANNNNINGSSTTRPMFGVNQCSAITLENLTLTNSTPLGGSQAEALLCNLVNQLVVIGCDLDSYQDTVLINQNGDKAYIQDSYIQGNTDYIWGSGTLYVTNTMMMDLTSQSHLTQPRTLQGTNGFAFVNCTILGAPGAINCDLGRDAGSSGNTPSFGYGQDAYINCTMDTNVITPAGWILGSGSTQGPDTANLRFWEYESVDTNGNLINTSSRVAWSTELSGSTATNQVQNVLVWLYGWQPQTTPYIITQPTSQSVAAGQTTSFNVTADGVPYASYQWQMSGTNLPGQNSTTLTISGASGLNIGTYSVIVTNNAGGVTSSNVTLTVAPPTASPAIASPSISGGNMVFNVTGATGSAAFGYRVWATTNLLLSPITNTWNLVGNGTFGTGSTTYTDTPATTLPQEFYIITVP